MAKINQNYDKLAAGYLFPEIARRTNAFLDSNQGAEVLRLGIGDTTEPIVAAVLKGCMMESIHLGGRTYTVMALPKGSTLREALAREYGELGVDLSADEFFVSDGAKSDSANIQSIFSQDCVVAVQDPPTGLRGQQRYLRSNRRSN